MDSYGFRRSLSCLFLLIIVAFASISVTDAAFAAKKKKAGKKASTNKGFGAPPATLEETLAKFPTRMPPNPASLDCPCGSEKTYGNCCGPLHESQVCPTMTDVLRSRYSAFKWRNIGHIIATTHPTCRDYQEDKVAWAKDLNKEGMFDSFEFVKLQVGPEEAGANENEGFIEFKVTMKGRDEEDEILKARRRSAAAVAGMETVVKERSRFLRDPDIGAWTYASGDVSSEVAGLEDAKLNS
mmetsp:Transcript_98316/g.283705  ORF Transcript_98316/g.283705 Transcript_98316/m.283705 type:complete len:240 (-) Transcript_98316:8-727(-)